MRKRNILTIIMALALVFGLVACKVDSEEPANTDEPASQTKTDELEDKVKTDGDSYTIGFVVSTQTNPFFVSLREGLEAKAKELGAEVITIDAQDDPAQASDGVEDLITRGVDLIVINPTDSDAIVPAVERANSQNIPVMTVDRMSNGGEVVSHIASDNIAGGELAGQYLLEQLGDSPKLIELEGIPGANSAIERGEGFEKAIKGSSADVVARQTANFDRTEGLNVMENLLQANPEVDGVFAQNDEMALGALEAIKASGRDILVVGFDATDDAVESVNNGELGATVAQKPELMGEEAAETAINHLKGEHVEEFVPVDLELISK